MFEDDEGTVWVGAVGGLSRVRGDRREHLALRPLDPEVGVTGIYQDRRSRLWIATPVGVFVRPTRSSAFQRHSSEVVARAFIEDVEGVVWAATRDDGLVPLDGGLANRARPLSVGDGYRLLFDRNGDLWVATLGAGLFRVALDGLGGPRVVRHFTDESGLAGTIIRALWEDAEGHIWVGTERGLSRLTATPILKSTLVFGQIANLRVRAVTVTPDDSLWVGTARGLYQFQGANRASYIEHPELQGVGIWALHADRHGALWVAAEGGKIARIENGRLVFVPVPDEILGLRSITTDAHDRLWLVDRVQGVLRWADNNLSRVGRRSDGASGMPISALTDSIGNVWVGFGNGNILRFDYEGGIEQYSQKNGIARGIAAALYEDTHGTIWAGSGEGLSYLSGDRFVTIHTLDGLSLGGVSAVVEDDRGYLWLGAAAGLVRLELSDFSRPSRAITDLQIRHRIFDASDGLAAVPVWQNGYPTATRDQRGLLYFVTSHGLAVVDPKRVVEGVAPLRTHVAAVSIDGQSVEPVSPIRLPPQARLTIRYSAATLGAYSKARFRYRLEGLEEDWVDANVGREVVYGDLPAGTYYFRVAGNLDGSWSESGSSLQVVVLPMFYETSWFLGLIATSLGAVVYLVWQVQVRNRRRQVLAAMAERARIGRELHDTLLQGLAAVPLYLENAENELGVSPLAMAERLKQLRHQVEASVRNARLAVSALRSSDSTEGPFAQSLETAGKKAVRGHRVDFEFEVRGTPLRLAPAVQQQLLRIGQEAIANAICHAHAKTIRVELAYDTASLTLRVHDDGRGFDKVDDHKPSEAGTHWGLSGMRERAQLIGASLSITSHPGHGVAMEVVAPLARSTGKKPD